jgi:hypothetical protein
MCGLITREVEQRWPIWPLSLEQPEYVDAVGAVAIGDEVGVSWNWADSQKLDAKVRSRLPSARLQTRTVLSPLPETMRGPVPCDRRRIHRAGVALQSSLEAAVSEVPDAHCPVSAARDDPGPVRRDRYLTHPTGVANKRQFERTTRLGESWRERAKPGPQRTLSNVIEEALNPRLARTYKPAGELARKAPRVGNEERGGKLEGACDGHEILYSFSVL